MELGFEVGQLAFGPHHFHFSGNRQQIVFTNTDAVLHHIVLDDGTDLGNVAPGTSSAPMPLMTPTATFHCTIHPSMVGGINVDMTAPMPDPYYPPPDDYYGYY